MHRSETFYFKTCTFYYYAFAKFFGINFTIVRTYYIRLYCVSPTCFRNPFFLLSVGLLALSVDRPKSICPRTRNNTVDATYKAVRVRPGELPSPTRQNLRPIVIKCLKLFQCVPPHYDIDPKTPSRHGGDLRGPLPFIRTRKYPKKKKINRPVHSLYGGAYKTHFETGTE